MVKMVKDPVLDHFEHGNTWGVGKVDFLEGGLNGNVRGRTYYTCVSPPLPWGMSHR